jgi:predicted O-methyltransferase YrrM
MEEGPFSNEVTSLDEIVSMHSGQPREQPLISENIHEQLKHMELSSWSISVHRRLRDAISRIQPEHVLEIGGQIGHRTSWLFDLIERGQWSPKQYYIVEEGPKFGVILKRLIQRYQHNEFTHVVIQNPMKYIEEYRLWNQTHLINNETERQQFLSRVDCILVDSNIEQHVEIVEQSLKLLPQSGYLFTVEPDIPTDDLDTELPEVQDRISMFNLWIQLIRDASGEFEIGFTPLHEGTLVIFRKRPQ